MNNRQCHNSLNEDWFAGPAKGYANVINRCGREYVSADAVSIRHKKKHKSPEIIKITFPTKIMVKSDVFLIAKNNITPIARNETPDITTDSAERSTGVQPSILAATGAIATPDIAMHAIATNL
jgi:hypothetical protein